MAALERLLADSPGISAVREQIGRLLRHQSEGTRRLPPVLILSENVAKLYRLPSRARAAA